MNRDGRKQARYQLFFQICTFILGRVHYTFEYVKFTYIGKDDSVWKRSMGFSWSDEVREK